MQSTSIGAKIGSIGAAVGALSALIGYCVALLINFVCERFGKFWNDPEFRDLYNSLLEYTSQLANGQDFAQEWLDTLVLFIVEALQIGYGEDWRDYCSQEIQDYYDEMNKTEDQSGGDTDQSDSDGCDENPPQTRVGPNIFAI